MRIYKPIDISDFTLESTRECDLSDENLSRYTNGIMENQEKDLRKRGRLS